MFKYIAQGLYGPRKFACRHALIDFSVVAGAIQKVVPFYVFMDFGAAPYYIGKNVNLNPTVYQACDLTQDKGLRQRGKFGHDEGDFHTISYSLVLYDDVVG